MDRRLAVIEGEAATRDSWKRQEFGELWPLDWQARFTDRQFAKIRHGLIPQVMEDKWFIYFEEPHLYLHRSWTGQPVYEARIEAESAWFAVTGAWLCPTTGFEHDLAHEAALLDCLVRNLLLGERRPYPLAKGEKSMGGLVQHSVMGTAYPEEQPRRWWHFWRA